MQGAHLLESLYEDIISHIRVNGSRKAEIMPTPEVTIESLQMARLRFQIQLLLQWSAELQEATFE